MCIEHGSAQVSELDAAIEGTWNCVEQIVSVVWSSPVPSRCLRQWLQVDGGALQVVCCMYP